MIFSAWLPEFNRIALVFVPCILIGLVSGYLPQLFIIGLIVYGLWTARQLTTLKQWLDDGADTEVAPEYVGIVDQYVSSIVDLQKAHRCSEVEFKDLVSRYKEMISALPDAVVIMAATGEIILANQAAQNLLHIHPLRDRNTRITQLVRDPDFIDYFSAQSFDQPLEIRGTTDREPELNIRIISFGRNKRVLIAQDMSQSARIYEMRRSFISNASHELRTPLTVISGYLESLSAHQDMPEEYIQAIVSAELQAKRMGQLVEDLLTLSRLESTSSIAGFSEVVPVASFIAEAIEEAKLSAWFAEHEFTTQIDHNVLLKGDAQEIHSVVSNLISNAVKHTRAGSKVHVVWKQRNDGSLEFAVEDNGQGIATEHLGRLTERFYRVDAGRSREKGGTGLGLSIVKHVLERHKASLQITSELGEGTVFSCHFPASRMAERTPSKNL